MNDNKTLLIILSVIIPPLAVYLASEGNDKQIFRTIVAVVGTCIFLFSSFPPLSMRWTSCWTGKPFIRNWTSWRKNKPRVLHLCMKIPCRKTAGYFYFSGCLRLSGSLKIVGSLGDMEYLSHPLYNARFSN